MRTVAIQLITKSLFPSAVLMPADRSAVLNLPLRFVKTASAALEAARRKIVARMEVVTLAIIARGMQQLRMFKPFVRSVKSNARIYAIPRNRDSPAYPVMEFRVLELCNPVVSSFSPVDGLKWKPK